MSMLLLKAREARSVGPAELVREVVLPLLNQARTSRSPSGGTVLTLLVEGDRGGAFTFDLEQGEAYEGRAEDPDCLLRLRGAAFESLLRGRLDADAALAEGSLRCFGDVGVLHRFARLLQGRGLAAQEVPA